ncbi:sensor histidine kinase KdpD [Vibrio sp. Evd11]|uniref:sensor histidine kinase n=1 Tax=Vibrio sp. Evd11 TaxID=1207404 RepID=UPI000EFAE8B7|nr:ATP-binding protein [Vibrio sp. Evd11]CAH6880516.1 Histidine kinase/DNA gyrase B/HSP90-like ATPase [Vibrio chagasii]
MKNEIEQLIADSLHELRSFNQKLNTSACEVSQIIRTDHLSQEKRLELGVQRADQARTHIENINYITQLITTRLDFIDYELNPDFFSSSKPYDVDIYGKFHRARIALNSTIKKHKVKVQLTHDSIIKLPTIKAVSLIDILPYLLLENAVKYSPNFGEVSVEFIKFQTTIEVHIKSTGPFAPRDEIKKLFLKGYRGENAKKLDVDGRGIGFYFADRIAKLHDAKLAINSSPHNTYSYNGVKYSDFEMRLTFPIQDL